MKSIYRNTLLLFITFLANHAYSQEKSIVGEVYDSEDNPIAFATIIVKFNDESSTSFGAITSNNGSFRIESIPTIEATLTISHVGYDSYRTSINTKTDSDIGKIILATNTTQLNDVTVAAAKPGIHRDLNKTIYVPEKRIIKDASSSFDILKQVPKVRISAKDYQVKVGNNTNVLVLIDGASSTRSLFSINPKEIERIELILNPGAAYESDATSVINIVLKKDNNGLYAFINGEYSLLNEVNNSAIQLVHNTNKTRIYGGYRLSHHAYDNIENEVQRVNKGLQNQQSYQSMSKNGEQKVTSHIFNAGVDIQPSEKALIQLSGSHSPSLYKTSRTSKVNISNGEQINYDTSERLLIDASKQTYNANYKQQFKDKTQYLEIQNTLRFINRDRNDYYDISSGSEQKPNNRYELTNGDWLTYASKIAYSQAFNDYFNYRVGAHYQLSTMDDVYTTNNNISKLKYKEERSHLFGSLEYSNTKFSALTSLGGERRDIDIHKGMIKNTQWYFLPMVSARYAINEQNALSASYNRRLSYPFYYMLVPFNYYSADSTSVSSGNPYLRPVLYDIIKLTHELEIDDKDFYMTSSVFYTQSKDKHDIRYVNSDGVLLNKWVNIGYTSSIGASLETYFYAFDCLDVTLEASSYYVSFPDNDYNGIVGDFYAAIDLALPWQLKMSAEAYLTTKEYDINGYYYHKPYFDSISLSRRFFKNNGRIKIVAISPFAMLQEEEKHWDNSFSEIIKTDKPATALSIRFTYTFNSNNRSRTYQKPIIDEQPIN